jgi:lysozyme
MVWLKLTSKALYLMDSDEYLEKIDLTLQQANPQQYKMDVPLDWLRDPTAPGKIIVALKTSTEPQKAPPPPPPVNTRHYIRITKQGMRFSNGLEALNVTLMEGSTVIDRVSAVAGIPGKQAFRLPAASKAGSREPLPEGFWDLGEPEPHPRTHNRGTITKIVEWAGGARDFSKDWPSPTDGLGPVWVSMYCRSWTERGDIGFHVDNNSASSPGTIGCVGIVNDSGLKSLKKFASWFDNSKLAPQVAIVDWELGFV